MFSKISKTVTGLGTLLFYIAIGCINFAHPLWCDATATAEIEKLPFCGDDTRRDASRRLLFVSTLDGKLSALDIANGGSLKWSVPTAPGGLLSSSIHRLELTNNGQWVRMIPSLNGGLFKFDGESIEPIPVTADHLLSASFKFSDDLVISGGKETRSYGISANNGKIVYECSMHGCKNTTDIEDGTIDNSTMFQIKSEDEHDPLVDELIVIRRQTQTVRAVEPRTGGERWNFSVGNHELDIIKPDNCHERPYSESDTELLNLQLKVIVPEGIVCAVQKENPNVILWQYQFDHPIVNAWKTSSFDELQNVDLFTYSHWPWSVDEIPENYENLSPSIYVGMFKKQLYIQESAVLKKIIQTNIYSTDYIEGENKFLKIPWKPLPATTSGLMLRKNENQPTAADNDRANDDSSVTALSILYASEYVNGNGFFLYSSKDLNKSSNGLCNRENATINPTPEVDDDDDPDSFDFQYSNADTPTKVIIVSLWYWWKQIIVISLVTALILNIFLSRRMPSEREVVIVERHVEVKVPVPIIRTNAIDSSNGSRRTVSESSTTSNFTSRFSTDFELVQCLGRGGFGVVFEAKNKLDDCNYAIKRIMLPNRQESRDRVMREVKTLAHCEHQHIVRYFQAWVETPPPGWQEKEDKLWMENDALLSHSIDIPSPSDMMPQHSAQGTKKIISEVINKKNKQLDQWISNLHTNECINFDDHNRKTTFAISDFSKTETKDEDNDDGYDHNNDNDDDDDDDDSFIQFKEESVGPGGDSIHQKRLAMTNSILTANTDENSNGSFRIEFKHSTNGYDSDETRSKAYGIGNDEKDSVFIDLKCWSGDGSGDHHRSKNKKRTKSENEANTNYIISIDTDKEIAATATAIDYTSEIRQFKKTHRRPLSLDLTTANSDAAMTNYIMPNNRMYLYIQMQLCKKQSLKEWLRDTTCEMVRKTEIVPIFKQIVDAVEYVHLKGLIHRDLKPSNIFFSLDGQIKIGDFGLVTDMHVRRPDTPCGDATGRQYRSPLCVKHTEKVGTYLYMSPEQLSGRHYNYKVDIYSLGLIFFELLVVFGTEMERIEILKALRVNQFPDQFSALFKDEYKLLSIMLSQNPDERPTTIGIRSRPPLGPSCASETSDCAESQWHFDLPQRRRDSHISTSGSNAVNGHSSSSS